MNRIAQHSWLLAALLLVASISKPALANDLTLTRYVATDKSIALRIAYTGTVDPSATGPTVQVEADGDMLFTTDGTTADTSVSTDGMVLLTTPSTPDDTLGEVAAVIDASPNWACILVDCLPSQSSQNVLSTTAESDGTTGKSATYSIDGNGIYDPEGLAVTVNLADVDQITACVGPEPTLVEQVTTARLTDRKAQPASTGAAPWYASLSYAKAVGTYSSGAPDFEVWLVKGSTEILLWSQTGAASTAASTIDLTDLPPIAVGPGARLIVAYDDDSTPDLTAGTLQVHGRIWQ